MMTGEATRWYRPVLERKNAGSDIPGYVRGGMIGAARGGAGGGFSGGGGGAVINNDITVSGAGVAIGQSNTAAVASAVGASIATAAGRAIGGAHLSG